MKKFILSGVLTMFVAGIMFIPNAKAQTTTVLEQIQALMEQLVELQNQLAVLKGELKDVIKDGLKEGMTDEDIAEVQEILASDPTIYPQGLVTGYFGPLTREALKRFQARYDLEINGEIDEETRAAMETLLEARFDGKVPPGLLRAPGIQKKFELRLREGCDNSGPGKAPFCKKIRIKYELEDDDDEEDDTDESNDDDSDDSNEFEVEVEIEDDGTTKVSFKFDGDEYDVEVASADLDLILDAAKIKVDDSDDPADLDEDLVTAIKAEFDAEVAEEADDEEEKEEDEEDDDDVS